MATYYWIGGSGTLNDYTHWSTTSGGSPLTAWPNNPNSATNITNTLVGATGTLLQNGSVDDNFLQVTLPFTINFLGTPYSSIFVGSNSYITFGTGSSVYSNLSASNPALPKIMLGSADNSYQRIYQEITGTTPNRVCRIRYEGTASVGGITGSPTIVWEALFYENIPNQIDIQVGSHARLTGVFGVYGAATHVLPIPPTQNTGTRIVTVTETITTLYFLTTDDIVFNSASGSANYTVTASTSTFTVGNVTINGPSTGTLTIGLENINVYGTSFSIAASGVVISTQNTIPLVFKGNNSNQTIITNAVVINCPVVIDSGTTTGAVVLGGALSLYRADGTNIGVTITSGTFTTSNYNITCGSFNSSNSNTRTINLGSSTITLGTVTGFSTGTLDFTTSTGLTFNCGTSTITTATNATYFYIYGGGQTFYNVTINGTYGASTLFISGTNTFNNLTVNIGNFSNSALGVAIANNITITGTFSMYTPANWPSNRMFLASATQGTPVTISAGGVSFRDVDFQDITATGAAIPWSGVRLGDCTGCSNITFAAARTVYWNGSGTNMNFWGSGSTYGWTTSIGGTPDVLNYPLPQDTAVFVDTGLSSGSSIGATTNDSWITRYGTLDFSQRTLPLTINVYISQYINYITKGAIYKDLKLSSAVTMLPVSASVNSHFFKFRGNTTSNIYPNNCTAGGQWAIDKAPTVSVVLQGNFTAQSTNYFMLYQGILNLNNYTLNTGIFYIGGTAIRNLDFSTNGKITCTATASSVFQITNSTNVSFSGTGILNIEGTTSSISLGSITVFPVTLQVNPTISLTITGGVTFNNITTTTSNAKTIIFPTGTTTFNNWNLNGTSGNLVTLQSSTAGTKANLKNNSGTPFNMSYVSVKDCAGSPTNQWKALIKNGCVNAGNNTGWVFTPNSGMLTFFT